MEIELKSWGERYVPEMKHSSDTNCPSCYWQLNGMGLRRGIATFILGFSLEAPQSRREGRVGSFIVKCPKCFEKYFYHCTMKGVEICKKLGKWPVK